MYTYYRPSTKYEGHLVANSFKQEQGIHLDEIPSHVVKVTIPIAQKQDLELVNFLAKTTFLHGNLDENTYMEQP